MIARLSEQLLRNQMSEPGISILCGPRGVGKSTLLRKMRGMCGRALYMDGDAENNKLWLAMQNKEDLLQKLSELDVLIIDEAQRFPGIKPAMELVHSTLPHLTIILGCSFFTSGMEGLARQASMVSMLPLSTTEIYDHSGHQAVVDDLSCRLVYGNYPEVYQNSHDRSAILGTICSQVIHHDILSVQRIKRPFALKGLLQVLALRLGTLVTYTEIGIAAGMDAKTVEKYLDLLERAYLLYRIWSYSKSVPNELKRSFKVYFVDNGIRNWILDDFRSVDKRQDADALWQNYFIGERRKALLGCGNGTRQFFWRSTQKQEIGLVELSGKKMSAYAIKWVPAKPMRLPLTFSNSYPSAKLEMANRANYLTYTLQSQIILPF